MKKLFTMLLALVVCIGMMSMVASAAGSPNLAVSSKEAEAGDTVELTVKLSNNPGIAMLEFDIDYDTDRLSLEGMTTSGLAGAMAASRYIWVTIDAQDHNDNGTILTLKFKVKDGAALGDAGVKVTGINCGNWASEVISVGASAGKVTVVCDHNYVKDDAASSDATCGKDGKLVEVCSKCGDTKTTTLDATGNHNYVKDTAASSDATCGKDGKLVEKCSVCGDTKETVLTATGNHNYVKDTAASSDATCGKDGKLVEKCSVCGDTKETVLTATGNHKNGTYTKIDGNDKQHKVSCSVCGKEDELENHSWNTGKVTTPATCGQPGSKTLTCTKCGYEKTEVIDATGKHTYTYTDVNDDQHKVECSVCDYEELAAHSYDKGKETVKPGHLPGEKTYTCADCGGTKVEVIDPTSDKHVLNKDGWTSYDDTYHYGECECGETMKEKHDWKWVTDKEATKTEAGEKHEECECGAKRNEGTVIKPGKDPVPDTGDITSQVVMTGAVALVVMMGAVALVFKRKNAK